MANNNYEFDFLTEIEEDLKEHSSKSRYFELWKRVLAAAPNPVKIKCQQKYFSRVTKAVVKRKYEMQLASGKNYGKLIFSTKEIPPQSGIPMYEVEVMLKPKDVARRLF